jgi:predicted 3-demethylubiquinone-9 3-methyltransferase (glyoxalase superfamily)
VPLVQPLGRLFHRVRLASVSLRATTQLMFQGQAEEALDLYTEVFADAEVEEIERVGADGPGVPGSIERAVLRLGDRTFQIFDSPVEHDFTFTPSVSLSVELEDPEDVDRAFDLLADGGQVLMPLGAHPFSPHYGWPADRFGVSWQIGLAALL